MLKSKRLRDRGKIQLSQYFQELNEGDKVSVVKEHSIESSFPERIQGKTGIIEKKRGEAYLVKIMDFNKEKRFIIPSIHLKKLK